MNSSNQPFEQLDRGICFSEEQTFKLNKAIKERVSKKGLESFGISILIVEDQDFSRKLLYDLLARQFVYTCYAARNAAEALELYATHAPDIVFLDIILPDYTGHEIATLIKSHDPKSYIIMVTANNFIKDVETAKRNNVQGYITKPYSKNKIQAAVDGYMAAQTK
jgi:two-component system, chemotaxis family, chemotaxis protein CheY